MISLQSMWYTILSLAGLVFFVSAPTAFSQSVRINQTAKMVGPPEKPFLYVEFPHRAYVKEQALLTTPLGQTLTMESMDSLQLTTLPNCLIQGPHGIQYVRVFLLNPRATALPLLLAGAMVSPDLTLLFEIEGQWMALNTVPAEYCGNAFSQDFLAPHSYLAMDVDVYSLFRGSIPTPCKVVTKIGTEKLETPGFTVQLTADQNRALRQQLPDMR